MSRVAAAAIEAALDEEKPRKGRLTGVKAVATGAALAMAAQAAAKRAPVHRLADLPERLRERVQERGWLDDDEPDSRNGHYDEPEDEEDEEYEPEDEEDEDFEPEDEEDEDSEPEDEEDEDFEPEDEEEEPQAEAGDDEPEAEADEEPEESDRPDEPAENGAADDVPNVLALLSAQRPRRRFMSRATARVDPAARPPEPPESDSDSDSERSDTTQEAGA